MRKLVLLLLGVVALLVPAAANAHPLGNFTVNRYSGIELSGERVYVQYVLDLAEIPTVQEGDAVRAPGFASRMGEGLVLELDGRRVPLVPLEHEVIERPGAGGLKTLRSSMRGGWCSAIRTSAVVSAGRRSSCAPQTAPASAPRPRRPRARAMRCAPTPRTYFHPRSTWAPRAWCTSREAVRGRRHG